MSKKRRFRKKPSCPNCVDCGVQSQCIEDLHRKSTVALIDVLDVIPDPVEFSKMTGMDQTRIREIYQLGKKARCLF